MKQRFYLKKDTHNNFIKNGSLFIKELKVIKIPNTDVFQIVAPILLDRGISRIVNAEKLIALEV